MPARERASPPSGQGRPLRWVRGVLSAIVPGLGQLVAGRIGDAVLFLVAFCWTRLWFAGLATDGERLSAALGGAFGMARGLAMPTAVVITFIALAIQVFAAWDAARWEVRTSGETHAAPGG
jgi:TM2 domain-containing membrane protein YozV